MESNELKPCPFCGSEAIAYITNKGFVSSYCCDCGACGPEHEQMKEAHKLWNTRPTEDRQAALEMVGDIIEALNQDEE